MTPEQLDEYRILRSMAIGLVEAIFDKRVFAIPPEVGDVLIEWLEHPVAQQEPIVVELITRLNNAPDISRNRQQRRRAKCATR